MKKVLFILKKRDDYTQDPSYSEQGLSTGLINSSLFVNKMLNESWIESKVVTVIDNNCINKEVTSYKPTHVIIEALWVTPEKFYELVKLHPLVKWIVRLHSDIPFLSNEGIAIEWILDYTLIRNVYVAVNSLKILKELKHIFKAYGYSDCKHDKLLYLPNYYDVGDYTITDNEDSDIVHVACFGAIRPLKNQLIQAVAAIIFANKIKKKLYFHVNTGRIEMNGNPILSNLESLFDKLKYNGHRLIKHEWANHFEFIKIIKTMDIGMQVSFSETFNIVSADMVSNGVPIVVSKEIPWAIVGTAEPTNSEEIAKKLHSTWRMKNFNVFINRNALKRYVEKSKNIWLSMFH